MSGNRYLSRKIRHQKPWRKKIWHQTVGLLREESTGFGLMVHIRRRRHYKTTDSNHHYRKYPNLIAELVPSRPNEVWVSDITYVETGGGTHAVRDAAQMLEKRMGGGVE